MVCGPGQMLILWVGLGGLWCRTGLAAVAQGAHTDGMQGVQGTLKFHDARPTASTPNLALLLTIHPARVHHTPRPPTPRPPAPPPPIMLPSLGDLSDGVESGMLSMNKTRPDATPGKPAPATNVLSAASTRRLRLC